MVTGSQSRVWSGPEVQTSKHDGYSRSMFMCICIENIENNNVYIYISIFSLWFEEYPMLIGRWEQDAKGAKIGWAIGIFPPCPSLASLFCG